MRESEKKKGREGGREKTRLLLFSSKKMSNDNIPSPCQPSRPLRDNYDKVLPVMSFEDAVSVAAKCLEKAAEDMIAFCKHFSPNDDILLPVPTMSRAALPQSAASYSMGSLF